MHNYDEIMAGFQYAHLASPELKDISSKFAELANILWVDLPDNGNCKMTLTLLLQAKDAAIRSMIYGSSES